MSGAAERFHIVRGSSGPIIFRYAHIQGNLIWDEDSLSCGPIPSAGDPERWTDVRRRFWAGVVPNDDRIEEPVALPAAVARHAGELRAAHEVLVWAGAGLDDQLFLCHALVALRHAGVSFDRIRLPRLRGRDDNEKLPSLGVADSDDAFGAMHNMECVLPPALDAAEGIWRAFSSSRPEILAAMIESPPRALPDLADILPALARRFPDPERGLPFWDRRLLENAGRYSPRTAAIVGGCIIDRAPDDMDTPGDLWLLWRLLRLGDPALSEPLVRIDRVDAPGFKKWGSVYLTPFGERVLEGQANHVDRHGIDEWVGGVHLDSARGEVWWNAGGRLTPERPR